MRAGQSQALTTLLDALADADVRRLAWTMASPTLFDPARPEWQGRLRDDAWSARELARCREWLLALDRDAAPLRAALGDPMQATPLGHTFEKFVHFWQAARPDVRASTRGLVVREGGRTRGEFDIVLLRHDGVIETIEVTVKYYLNLRPDLGMAGCIGPRAFDHMTEKYAKMTTRQTELGHTDAGRAAITRWLELAVGDVRDPDTLLVENHALSRGYVFHRSEGDAVAPELSPNHGRGGWQTDDEPLPDVAPDAWRQLSGREWLGPYRGPIGESSWPNDPAMPRLLARLGYGAQAAEGAAEVDRRFVVRADAGLLKAFEAV